MPVLEARPSCGSTLGDEELHPALHVGPEHGLRALGDACSRSARSQVSSPVDSRALRMTISYSPTVNSASTVTLCAPPSLPCPLPKPWPAPLPRVPMSPRPRPPQGSCSQYSTRRGAASWSIAVEHRAGERLHVLLLEDHRDRDHHGEPLGGPLVVVLHREDGARPVAEEHHHGGVVPDLGVRARGVEAAERRRRAGGARGPPRGRAARGGGASGEDRRGALPPQGAPGEGLERGAPPASRRTRSAGGHGRPALPCASTMRAWPRRKAEEATPTPPFAAIP